MRQCQKFRYIMIVNIHDLINPKTGNSYKEDNLKLKHKFNIGDLVEDTDTGVRLFVAEQTRDCDKSLLYSLTINLDIFNRYKKNCREGFSHQTQSALGYPEYCLKLIKPYTTNH